MLTNRGETGRRRRIRLRPAEAASRLSPWIRALGYEVTPEEPDLQVVCGSVSEVSAFDGPSVVILPPGARPQSLSNDRTIVLGAQSHLLDLASAVRSLLFETHAAHRRYCREQFAGVAVAVTHEHGESDGRLHCVTRRGAFVTTEQPVPPEQAVQLKLVLPERTVVLKARSVFSSCEGSDAGFAVEFDLGALDVAPALGPWIAPAASAPAVGLTAG